MVGWAVKFSFRQSPSDEGLQCPLTESLDTIVNIDPDKAVIRLAVVLDDLNLCTSHILRDVSLMHCLIRIYTECHSPAFFT